MKYLSRSILILILLYGIVFAICDALLVKIGAPDWALLIIPVLLALFQFLVGPALITYFFDIHWTDEFFRLPEENQAFIQRVCADRGLKVPRLGIIESGTPNAFCFGHYPGNARLVVTRGLLDVCTTEETNAVLAHELGHIEHWDFVVMTIASIVPLLLYQIYVIGERINQVRAIAYGAYIAYLISQYIVLSLNRIRESFADHYSAKITGAPDELSSALIKIAYGMVGADSKYRAAKQKDYGAADKEDVLREGRISGAFGVLGISSLRAGEALSVAVADPTQAAAVMHWDVANPWARIYELSSTHPLTAMRVRELNRDANSLNRPTRYPLPSHTYVKWSLFPLELFLWLAPVVGAIFIFLSLAWNELLDFVHITISTQQRAGLLVFTGVLWFLRVLFRYRGSFEEVQVAALLSEINVSEMTPKAVTVRGEIVGKGTPGWYFSADMMLRDETGMIFILYRPGYPLGRWLFAGEAENLIGQKVEIQGWYRRSLRPYIEMSRVQAVGSQPSYAYSRWSQYALSVIAVMVGTFLLIL